MIIAEIISYLRAEMQMDERDRAVSRIKRNYAYYQEELDPSLTANDLIKQLNGLEKERKLELSRLNEEALNE